MRPPAQQHSWTSRAAAAAIEPSQESLKERVHRWISFMGTAGSTDEEGCTALQMNPSTYRPRRIELEKAGLIEDSDTTRRTVSGRWAVVWVATSANTDGRRTTT